MKLIRYPQNSPLIQASCATVGNFDGVHLGHQTLIADVVAQARKSGRQSVVVTMQPLPVQYFQGDDAVEILTPLKHKYQLIKRLGVDVMCVLNFNQQLAAMTAHEFYRQIIIEGLCAEYVMVGDDFRFGAHRQGDFELLCKLSESDGVEVKQMETVTAQSNASTDIRISSTAIRERLRHGDFDQVKRMLGRDFNLMGKVASGKKIGRTIGYPTINIELKQGAFSLHGIYVVEIVISGHVYEAVASVGYNPSVGGNAKRVEVYVLDFDQQVYGESVEVLFYKKLRNEVKFDGLAALTSAIEEDVRLTRTYFNQKTISGDTV